MLIKTVEQEIISKSPAKTPAAVFAEYSGVKGATQSGAKGATREE